MIPNMNFSPEELEDGSMLRNAILAFNQEKDVMYFLDILQIMRDSYIWIPCNMIMSGSDHSNIEQLIKQAMEKDDLDSLIGTEFTTQDVVRMVPDILINSGKYFFPVFTSPEEMGEYGTHFSKIQQPFLAAINKALHSEKDITGIVVNAFTTPFVLDRELFETVQNMISRLN